MSSGNNSENDNSVWSSEDESDNEDEYPVNQLINEMLHDDQYEQYRIIFNIMVNARTHINGGDRNAARRTIATILINFNWYDALDKEASIIAAVSGEITFLTLQHGGEQEIQPILVSLRNYVTNYLNRTYANEDSDQDGLGGGYDDDFDFSDFSSDSRGGRKRKTKKFRKTKGRRKSSKRNGRKTRKQ